MRCLAIGLAHTAVLGLAFGPLVALSLRPWWTLSCTACVLALALWLRLRTDAAGLTLMLCAALLVICLMTRIYLA